MVKIIHYYKERKDLIYQFIGDIFFYILQFSVIFIEKKTGNIIRIGIFTNYILAISAISLITSLTRDNLLLYTYSNRKPYKRVVNDIGSMKISIFITIILIFLSFILNIKYISPYVVLMSLIFGVVNSEFSRSRYENNFKKYLGLKLLFGLFILTSYGLFYKVQNDYRLVYSHMLSTFLILLLFIKYKYLKILIKYDLKRYPIAIIKFNIFSTLYSSTNPASSFIESNIIANKFGLESLGNYGFYLYFLRIFTFIGQGLNRFYAISLMKIWKEKNQLGLVFKIIILNFIMGISLISFSYFAHSSTILFIMIIIVFLQNTKNSLSYYFFANDLVKIISFISITIETISLVSFLFTNELLYLLVVKTIMISLSVLIYLIIIFYGKNKIRI